ncbi:hypothetical protein Anacy_1172 [Anabaena cylindrica PCC 7122]|uniref:Uncharacterized protein n=1 Tax=Anabaena cylindrica (strain ATCC 27899 / PCC 7122) TaxID=272123 RepID=K9ZDC5_ANACC|nr:hypothetical protein Anacy_1172 [Anabaena cylindrica PCC 7122]BAY00805.1 hypothetical protein NIES19_00310 [Anabaena cylindrica PCC 7122]
MIYWLLTNSLPVKDFSPYFCVINFVQLLKKRHINRVGGQKKLAHKIYLWEICAPWRTKQRVDGKYYQASNVTQDRTQKDYRVSFSH